MSTNEPSPPGVIETNAVYTLDEFCARTGMSDTARRHAERRGLKVRTCGKRKYILGRDWLEFLEDAGSD